jgi:3',5'-cyclic AMP phosphodiesterase CpdA
MRIAQITDAHVTAEGTLWKDWLDTRASLAAAVDALNRIAPDLVVLTGDLTEVGAPEEYAAARAILDRLDAPLRLIPGNHDARGPMRAAFPDQPWQGDFLHFAETREGLRVLGLDTVTPGETAGAWCAARSGWLAGALDGEAPTLVFLHHPPCAMGLDFMDQWPFAGGEALGDLIEGRDVLRLACGHVHAPVERLWRGALVTAAPALSAQIPPLQKLGETLALRPGGGAIRLHDWVDGRLTVFTVPIDAA